MDLNLYHFLLPLALEVLFSIEAKIFCHVAEHTY